MKNVLKRLDYVVPLYHYHEYPAYMDFLRIYRTTSVQTFRDEVRRGL